MHKTNFNEYDLALNNLENLRLALNLEMQEIDEYAELGTNAYSRIIHKKQVLRLDELITIGKKIYNLKAVQLLSQVIKAPNIQSLPIEVARIAKERKGKSPRTQEKRDIIQYCILILDKYFTLGDTFANSQIKGYLKGELETVFKGKSIEWSKSILSPFVEDTKETKKAKTKAEKVYRLKKTIPKEMVEKASELVGNNWF